MINLDKLNSQFDIKNIDTSQITKLLLEHQKYVKLALLVVSLLVAWNMFSQHRIKEQGLRTQLSQEQEKLEIIKAREAAIQNFNDFKSTLPKELNVFDVVTLVSNDAKSYNNDITSYTPSQSRDTGLYNVIEVRFEIVADNFKDMMLFLRKIEKSKSPLRIESWSGHEGDDGKVIFTTEISAVLIHP